MSNPAKTSRCPICGVTVEWTRSPSRPFCSDRCKLIDLGGWASGRYAIPGEKPEVSRGARADSCIGRAEREGADGEAGPEVSGPKVPRGARAGAQDARADSLDEGMAPDEEGPNGKDDRRSRP